MRLVLLSSALLLVAPAFTLAEGGSDRPAPRPWSLRPPVRPAVPRLDDPAARAWVRTPVDAFILERLSRAGLRPAPEADRATLIRRLSFDLTGLPPTPEEVTAFVCDPAPAAYERLVDRLLASPRYGEHWGRHWLDVVRFAETEGFEYDRYLPGAWRYRDYVIDAFNCDKPYDRFLTEQLAGDELSPSPQPSPPRGEGECGDPELQVAAGFLRLGPVRRNAGNPEIAASRSEVLSERTDVIGVAFLALTAGCARCHDHKFDDFSQADYYRLQAFLAAAQEHDIVLAPASEQAAWKARTDRIQGEVRRLQKALAGKTGSDRERLEEQVRELEQTLPPPLPAISTVRDVEAERTPVHVLRRGDPDKKGRQVGPRFPGLLTAADTPELAADTPRARTLLARWISSPDNPRTARVLVNRVWQFHFGRGLVETANDFGANGSPPTHPELVDWLADAFVASGWRLKPLHRLIVLSSTYRQASSVPDARAGLAKDPDDRLLGRFPRRRLAAEEVRDAMLAVSGRLNDRAGGPSVVVPVDADQVKLLYSPLQWTVTRDVREHDRRSVYLLAKRNLRLSFLEAFDQPDAQTSCPRREASTHALQALELLNGRFANDLAGSFAERLVREAGPDPERQVERAYLLAAGRPPTAKEKELGRAFLRTQPLREFCLAVFNLNPFLYVD
jgi:hypothetical protein